MTSTANLRSSSRSINPLPDRSQSPHTANSSLRPRNRRLVSTELLNNSNHDSKSPPKQRYYHVNVADDVAATTLPKPHLSRTESNTNRDVTKGKGIWQGGWSGSWSTIQGIANSVLGGDISEDTTSSRAAANKARLDGNAKNSLSTTWGPSGSMPVPRQSVIGMGSLEERDREIRARKTASVLESHERVNGGLDVAGRFKRRTSVETLTKDDQDEEILVYVHPVGPKDTVTGVILRYNCQPAAFRKANRLWPNDVLQIRKNVLLPVDECGVKGRPCNGPEFESGVDLLAPTPSVEVPPLPNPHMNFESRTNRTAASDVLVSQQSSEITDVEEVPLWTHVRWVIIDSSASSKPISISRIRRKDLGYFPPRRRKSNASSAAGTPRASLDILSHHSSSTGVPVSPRRSGNHRSSNLSSQANPYFPPTESHSSLDKQRSTSTGRLRGNSVTASDTQRSAWMKGPGGVGTFAKNVRRPGPAQDGLNSWAAKHLPSLAIDYLPSRSIASTDTSTWRIESISEEQRPFGQSSIHCDTEEASNQGMGLENAAAAIEGWVRRLATRVPATPGTPKPGAGVRLGNGQETADGVGDLIELLDGSDDGRGFEPTTDSFTPAGSTRGSDRDDLLGAVRGRSGRRGKGE